jgi:hypothetical protein
MTAQFLLQGQMLLEMFIPFLMAAYGWSYLQQAVKQLPIFLPYFFIDLFLLKARIQSSSLLFGHLSFFFERLR